MANKNVFCSKCGTGILIDENKEFFFCSKCGNRGIVPKAYPTSTTTNEKKINEIPAVCNRCNGALTLSEDKLSAVCEYCGATYTNRTVFISRDETEIQRAEYEAKKRQIELEAEERKRKMEFEEIEKKRQYNKELEESRIKRVKILAEVWGWISFIGLYCAFIVWAVEKHNGNYHIGSVLLLVAVIFCILLGILSVITRLKNTKVTETPQNERYIVQEKVVYKDTTNRTSHNDNYVKLNSNSRNNSGNVKGNGNIAKGVVTGAAIGTGIAAGIAFKAIKKLLK